MNINSTYKEVKNYPVLSHLKFPYAFTAPRKNAIYIKLLQFVKDNPYATRKEIHKAVFGMDAHRHGDIYASGYYHDFWLMARRFQFVKVFKDKKNTYHYLLTKNGNELITFAKPMPVVNF